MRRRRRLAWTLLGVVVFTPAVGFALFLTLAVRPPSYSPSGAVSNLPVALRSWPEHDAIYSATFFPYVLALDGTGSDVRYIGVQHTSDAADPQLTEVERIWEAFRPTIALCEAAGMTGSARLRAALAIASVSMTGCSSSPWKTASAAFWAMSMADAGDSEACPAASAGASFRPSPTISVL